MRTIGAVLCVVAVCAVGLGAQSGEKTTKTKITIKDGKDVSVTGCVEKMKMDGSDYMLTNVADKDGTMHSYILITDDVDLSKHVGHRVVIEGKAADRGDGKVKTETKTKTKVEHGDDKETNTKSEVSGDLTHAPYLGVKSVKMIAASCP
jgi:hypothetical protein